MRFSKISVAGSLLFSLSVLASPVAQFNALASEVQDAVSSKNVLERRQVCSRNPLVGINDGAIVARPNIYDMEQDGDLWNLYILGLLRMQDRNQDDPLSFYRISGTFLRNCFIIF